MATKKMVLNFPPNLIDQPITYWLIREHDLKVNILRARITPREWGSMVVELNGDPGRLEGGLSFLREQGVGVEPLAEEVRWREERCIHCTACLAPCPTRALNVDRATMTMSFDRDKCIACELCLRVCPYRAVEIHFE
ncbi:MAG: NIL domain-containing protein [Thermodesulfobacteriota bacterium]